MRRIESQMNEVREANRQRSTRLPRRSSKRSTIAAFGRQIIEDLNARLPKEDIWITELVATSGGKPLGRS